MLRLYGMLWNVCVTIDVYRNVVHICSATSNSSDCFNNSSLSPLQISVLWWNGISVPCSSASCICKRWTGVSKLVAVFKPNNDFFLYKQENANICVRDFLVYCRLVDFKIRALSISRILVVALTNLGTSFLCKYLKYLFLFNTADADCEHALREADEPF